MPQQQILPTWIALNAGTLTSPSGLTDPRTGQPFMAGGLNVGDWFDITESEALSLSKTSVGTLHSGRYRFVQIDSGATLANIKTGSIGLIRNLTGGSYSGPINYVTTGDQANNYLGLQQPRKVVFLCPVTAGQSLTSGVFAFVQELGDATVYLDAAAVTTIGAAVQILSTGLTTTAATPTTATVGIASQVPAATTLCRVELTAPAFQE
jgi:hypothetical protein